MNLSEILPQPLIERVPDLTLGRLRPVLDLCQQLWLNPDALVRDLLGAGLRLPDQRHQPLPQLCRRGLVEAVVDLARKDQIVALATAHIDAVPVIAVECEASDGQRLALGAGLLYPVVAPA